MPTASTYNLGRMTNSVAGGGVSAVVPLAAACRRTCTEAGSLAAKRLKASTETRQSLGGRVIWTVRVTPSVLTTLRPLSDCTGRPSTSVLTSVAGSPEGVRRL